MSTQQLCDYAKEKPFELTDKHLNILLPFIRSFVVATVFLGQMFGDACMNICMNTCIRTCLFRYLCFIYVRCKLTLYKIKFSKTVQTIMSVIHDELSKCTFQHYQTFSHMIKSMYKNEVEYVK